MDLERVRADFRELLENVTDEEWGASSAGTRWNNEQLLFHMVFGFMIVQRLRLLVAVLGRLPGGVSRGYMRVLDATTRPFDAINYYGSCLAARIYNRRRMGAKMDRVIRSLESSLWRASDADLRRGIHFPAQWDPYFRDYMTVADMYRYAGEHYDHHRAQLTVAAA